MAFKFPWSNLHELNLDWILGVVKTLKESNDEFNEKADNAVATANEAKEIAEQASQATIADGSITTAKLANGAVTNEKLGTGSVTSAKIQDGTIDTVDLADSAVNTAKIANSAITADKIADQAVNKFKLYHSFVTLTDSDPDSIVDTTFASSLIWQLGGICMLRLSKRLNIPSDSQYHEIGSVPEYYRPDSTTEKAIPLVNTPVNLTMRIDTNGVIALRNNSGTAVTGGIMTEIFTYICRWYGPTTP